MPLLCLPLALSVWWRCERAVLDSKDLTVATVIALACSLPGVTLGWILLGITCMYLLARSVRRSRSALLLAAAASFSVPLTEHGLKWFATPLLSADAAMAAWLLQVLTGAGTSEGNLLNGPAEHTLVVLHGCSSLHNLGAACLGWWALHEVSGARRTGLTILALMFVAMSVVGLNLARLCIMAVDPAWHEWWHAGPGVHAYQAASTAMPILAALLSTRHGNDG